jgi:hypothetical protein
MTLVLYHVMLRDVYDQPGAVQKLHAMLLDSDTTGPEYTAYAATKQQILETEDPDGKLRVFKIPAQIKFRPPKPETADELRAYLQDAARLVQEFKDKCVNESSTPFRFDAFELSVRVEYCGDAIPEQHELLSLGVAVTSKLRNGFTGGFIPGTMDWASRLHGNVYPAIAESPANITSRSGVYHTLKTTWTTNTYELWSAVAYSSALRELHVEHTDYYTPQQYQKLARWMAYGLAHSPSLRNLEIVRFRRSTRWKKCSRIQFPLL